MPTRGLGKSGIEVSPLGMGCWAIGGPWTWAQPGEKPYPAGWGQTDDRESIRAIYAALDTGVTLFDTAANYGVGHSERILGEALKGRRDQAVIAETTLPVACAVMYGTTPDFGQLATDSDMAGGGHANHHPPPTPIPFLGVESLDCDDPQGGDNHFGFCATPGSNRYYIWAECTVPCPEGPYPGIEIRLVGDSSQLRDYVLIIKDLTQRLRIRRKGSSRAEY